ncbi:MAG: phycobiliprotein lyase [Pseudanabaena frigida]|uniref:Chromophore lyase CpcS/CpeS n=1 Tax=Pseudanabaena frigida TaxID=945775 RepID=A0A2W4VXB9_9CYAN|nr:MAG: phycobiliprotein lyase [Pseudanabaena frigida]
MLSIEDFFTNCTGLWKTDRTYHTPLDNEVERSYTEFWAIPLTITDKQNLITPNEQLALQVDLEQVKDNENHLPGFAIAFDTVSEKGEKFSMQLKALFVPYFYVLSVDKSVTYPDPPTAAQVTIEEEIIKGFYLRNEGYSEAGAIAGRFTYQPTRQTLEMTTYYRRSVAVDQMRFLAPDLRLRTIVTYKREPDSQQTPTEVSLVGFGLERRYPLN